MPRFTVIIPTYNRCDHLKRALASVHAQSFKDYEVIVVDDGSTDETPRYLRTVHEKISVLRQNNAGPGAARNAGARNASGTYLAFLDSDDQWFPWTLEVFDRAAAEGGDPAILVGAVVEHEDPSESMEGLKVKSPRLRHPADSEHGPLPLESGGLPYGTSPQTEQYPDFISTSMTSLHFGAGMSIVKTDAFLQCGGFDEKIRVAEDHDLSLRLGLEKGFVKIESPPTLAYFRHRGGITASLELSIDGMRHLVSREHHGLYPGGPARRTERRRMICRHVRPVVLRALTEGKRLAVMRLLFPTLPWQLADRRFRFLAASAAYAILPCLCRRI